MRSNKLFLPVIHCLGQEQNGINHAIENAKRAESAGADGVFLIGHHMYADEVVETYQAVRVAMPRMWIGVNFLGINAAQDPELLLGTAMRCHGLNALWCDHLPEEPTLKNRGFSVFGGVAFKYLNPNPSDEDLARDCARARNTVDIITTSGNSTGSGPSVEKLQRIRKCIGEQALLAVASGVNAKNVASLLPYADLFLIASSIVEQGDDGTEWINVGEARKLADLIHA